MKTIVMKPLKKEEKTENKVIIEFTKDQLMKYVKFFMFLFFMSINLIAIVAESPFLNVLFLAQTIVILTVLIKNSNKNLI